MVALHVGAPACPGMYEAASSVHPSYLAVFASLRGRRAGVPSCLPGVPGCQGIHAYRWAPARRYCVGAYHACIVLVQRRERGTHISHVHASSMRDPRVSYLALAKAL